MQEREHRGDQSGSELHDQTPCDSTRGRSPLVHRGDQQSISNVGCSDDQHQELAYDYYITIARMWDDPKRSFDLRLNK